MFLVYLMIFIKNMELYMKRLHHNLLKWMVNQKEKIELLLNMLLQLSWILVLHLIGGGKFYWLFTMSWNQFPKSKSKIYPNEILRKRQPNLSYLRTWGCLAYVRISDPKWVKITSRAYEYAFIGYATNNKTYRFYDLNDKVIIKWNDVKFYEDKFPFKSRNSRGI